jgi:hypothetical protein
MVYVGPNKTFVSYKTVFVQCYRAIHGIDIIFSTFVILNILTIDIMIIFLTFSSTDSKKRFSEYF